MLSQKKEFLLLFSILCMLVITSNSAMAQVEPSCFTCPGNIVIPTNIGECSSQAYFPQMDLSKCPTGTSVNYSIPSGSTFPLGTTSVIATVSYRQVTVSRCTFLVTVVDREPPIINCPTDITVSAALGQGMAIVNFSLPTATDNCSNTVVTASPHSGSKFPIGATVVTVTATDSFGNRTNCRFTVNVRDAQPPSINCPADLFFDAPADQCSMVVNYPAINVSDNSGNASLVVTPPSGSIFPIGTTTVRVTATDNSGNIARCSFNVTIRDQNPPTILCPADIEVMASGPRCSTIVDYPPLAVVDECQETIIEYSIPAGSAFSVGTTRVLVNVKDASGNESSCSFNVRVNGEPQVTLKLEGNNEVINLGPVSARRTPRRRPPFASFTLENIGCAPLSMNFASLLRTGEDVNNGTISLADDSGLFSLRVGSPGVTGTPVEMGQPLTITAGERMTVYLLFNPLFPAVADRHQGLTARQVLPPTLNSNLTIAHNSGAPLTIGIVGHITTGLKLIDPVNPQRRPEVRFTRFGDEFTAEFSIYDANLDVNRATFQFFNRIGQVVGSTISVDLAQAIEQSGLVMGQSFTVIQRFTGANDNNDIVSVRINVFDGESSVSISSGLLTTANLMKGQLPMQAEGVSVVLPIIKLVQTANSNNR
ncbi:MAG: HYR domain-containing protein [Acidobacteriota bacterium]